MPRESQKISIPITVPDKNHKFATNFETFDKMLLKDDIKDSNIAVVSIAGAPRKGKSFLMNFCAHYLKMMYNSSSESNTGTWLKNDDVISSGFVWRAGTTKVTTGIQMWPEIFHATVNGEKVAIILLDTQGTFDKDSTVEESVVVFALSTLLSSVQIYNVSNTIEGEHLQHLQLFTEYGRFAHNDENGEKPFQKLQILIRDWCAPFEHPYGAEGGGKFLDRILQISDDQPEELKSIRKSIKSCFADIRCFLMPEPGKQVKYDTNFHGNISAMDSEFVTCLQQFILSLFSAENLIVKEIDGRRIKVKDFVNEFKNYVNILTSVDLPQPKTILMSMVEMGHRNASNEALIHYNEVMSEYQVEKYAEYVTIEDLKFKHDGCKSNAMEIFEKSRCKMGGNEICEKFHKKLEEDIDSEYAKSVNRVQKKNEKIVNKIYGTASLEAKERYINLMKERPKSVSATSNYIPIHVMKQHHEDSKVEATQVFIRKVGENFGGQNRYEQELENLEESIEVFYDGHLEEVKKNNQVVAELTCDVALSNALGKYRQLLPRTDMKHEEKQERSLEVFDETTRLIKLEEHQSVRATLQTLVQEMRTTHTIYLKQAKAMAKNSLGKLKKIGVGGAVVGTGVVLAVPVVGPIIAAIGGVAATGGAVVYIGCKYSESRIDGCEEIDEI